MKRGFVLIELLVALSLVAMVSLMVFSFYQFTQRHVQNRQRSTLAFSQSQTVLRSISRNIRSSRSTLYLGPKQWGFISAQGETASYSFENGILRFDSLAVFRDNGVEIGFTGFGQDSLLDLNRDQDLDLAEMDLSADGKLDAEEAFRLKRIRVTITPLDKGETFAVYTEETIRNRM